MKKYYQKPNIKVSEEVKIRLDKIGNKGDTYEDVIGNLIDFKERPQFKTSKRFKVENVRDSGLSKSERCLICGTQEDLTIHSLFGEHKPPFKIVCRGCHNKIELIKAAIKIMEREKKISSVRQFRKIIDNLKGGGEK